MIVDVTQVASQLWVSVRENPESGLVSWDVDPLAGLRSDLVRELVAATSATGFDLGAVIIRLNFESVGAAEQDAACVQQMVEARLPVS